jgi:F0F1-type ATP synthase membrane subunit c/vacuolar-type H+-ATPase subunit K
MNQLSIIAIIGAAMLVGMTVQHQALAYSRDDALAGSLQDMRPYGEVH